MSTRRGETLLDHLLLFSLVLLVLLVLAWWRLPDVQRALGLWVDRAAGIQSS
jgi:hypothetical protein